MGVVYIEREYIIERQSTDPPYAGVSKIEFERLWSNGKTAPLHGAERGSIPRNRIWARSSARIERLAFNQTVEGSNPSEPVAVMEVTT